MLTLMGIGAGVLVVIVLVAVAIRVHASRGGRAGSRRRWVVQDNEMAILPSISLRLSCIELPIRAIIKAGRTTSYSAPVFHDPSSVNIYRVTQQVVPNLPLTSKQGLVGPGQAKTELLF